MPLVNIKEATMRSMKTLYRAHYRKGILISVLFICAAGVILPMNLVSLRIGAQEAKRMNVSVQGPRPMAKAIELLEARCRCVITYEDPRYAHRDDVADVTVQVRRDLDKFKPGEAPKVFVPKSETLALDYDELPNTNNPDGMTVVVRQVIETHAAMGNAGRFRVELNDQSIHVIPTGIRNERGDLAPQESVLDSLISLPLTNRSGIQTLDAICAAISQTNGTQVILGAVPLNAFVPYHDRQGATSQRARDVLVNLLKGVGDNFSWQLFYDPGMKVYALNIHQVPKTSASK